MSNLSNKTIEGTYRSVLNIGTDLTPNGSLTSALSTITDGNGTNSSLSISTAGNGVRIDGTTTTTSTIVAAGNISTSGGLSAVGTLRAGGNTYPTTAGNNFQVLATNGSGSLYFTSVGPSSLSALHPNPASTYTGIISAITVNANGLVTAVAGNSAIFSAIAYPASILNVGTTVNPNGNLSPVAATIRDGLSNNSSLAIATANNGARITGRLYISETNGTIASSTSGSLVISHDNNGGQSSIVFPSKYNYSGDYGYISYQDDSGNVSGREKAILCIGAENDSTGEYQDAVILQPGAGYVGVGTKTPKTKLDVIGEVTADFTSNVAQFRAIGGSYGAMIRNDGADTYFLLTNSGEQYGDFNTLRPLAINNANGQVTVGTNLNVTGTISCNSNLHVNGAISCNNDIVAFITSDRSLKDNIQNIENPIEKIQKINGVTFTWNDKQSTYTGKDIGVIAQEIEEVLPEVVATRDNGYKAVKYEKIVALLIESIKDLQKQINELKKQ